MSIRQCANHHYYDDEKYTSCPVCGPAGAIAQPTQEQADDRTLVIGEGDETIAYTPLSGDPAAQPVVGWLVCVQGEERGRDWRLGGGCNDIGTAAPTDILVQPRTTPSQSRLCSVIYDGKHKDFALVPGKGAIIYYNGGLLTAPTPLRDGDEIGIEGYVLCFQSFCGLQKNDW